MSTEHVRPQDLEAVPTRVVCQFHDGKRQVRIINWNDRNAVKRFAQLSRQCMLSGPAAFTQAERIPTEVVLRAPVPTEVSADKK